MFLGKYILEETTKQRFDNDYLKEKIIPETLCMFLLERKIEVSSRVL